MMLIVIGGVWLRESKTRSAHKPPPVSMERPAQVRAEVHVGGMDCLMCAAGLQNKLRALPGVSKAEVSFQDQRAIIEFDPSITDRARIDAAIECDGFKPSKVDSARSTNKPVPSAR